jgi:S1-C subfamily serine protease
MRVLQALLGSCFISICCSGYSAAQDAFVPLSEQSVEAGAAAAAPKVLSGDIASPFSEGISEKKIFDVLSHVPTTEHRMRGAHEIELFKKISPSVVYIQTTDAIGTGSVISDGLILTNYHVVGDAAFVGALYKPVAGREPDRANMVAARVIKVDQIRDLALLRPTSIPPNTKPVELADVSDLQIGADVHAIGHPKGEAWSYTKGIISQIRRDFSWAGDSKIEHRANVIQTQTPINPGNSGGPLLSDDGRMIGVNSFQDPKAQGLNFAVSVSDVRAFLAAPRSTVVSTKPPQKSAERQCAPKTLFEGRNKDNTASIRRISLQCDNTADLVFVLPDNKNEPMMALMDTKRRGKPDVYIFDPTRTANWQVSYWDVDFDDTFPLKGIHANGEIKPVRFEKRCPGRAGTNFRCL